jgi:hypothetical protein
MARPFGPGSRERNRAERPCLLNDAFRRTGEGARIYFTEGVNYLGAAV